MQLIAKVKQAWASGSLWPSARRYLAIRIWRPVEVTLGYARLPSEARRLDVTSGLVDHRTSPSHVRSNPEHLRRIAAAYRAAKAAEPHASDAYRIRGIWAQILATNFSNLISAANADDLSSLGALLEDHYRERFTSGMGGDELSRTRGLLGRWYIKYVWNTYFQRLRELGFDPARDQLSFPYIGNPAGAVYQGSVLTLETLRHIYHATEIVDVLRGVERPTIVEIGGGLGGQALQVLQRLPGAAYRIFDIPEVAIVSSYLLLSAFPSASVRLFGEGPVVGDYDIGVFPTFAADELADHSVDLFYNSASFSEMDARSTRAYLAVIERACRRYFMHDNHDEVFTFTSPDRSISTNLIGSRLVPCQNRFKRLYKKPRVHQLPEDRGIVHFQYLYERLTPAPKEAEVSTSGR